MKLHPASFTKRALVVGMLAATGILAASSFAMPPDGQAGKGGCEARHTQSMHGNRGARHAERLSALKAKLQLSPAQEMAWTDFAQASAPPVRPALDRQTMKAEFEKLNTPQRLDRMLALSEVRQARMAERATATKAFYAQLSPEQQSVFDAEAMRMRHHHGHAQGYRQS